MATWEEPKQLDFFVNHNISATDMSTMSQTLTRTSTDLFTAAAAATVSKSVNSLHRLFAQHYCPTLTESPSTKTAIRGSALKL